LWHDPSSSIDLERRLYPLGGANEFIGFFRGNSLRMAVTQNYFVDEVAALDAPHRHEPVAPQTFSDIHAPFLYQQTTASGARKRLAPVRGRG
jgi:hypothetical protein